jgi:hypothetical protein
MKKYDEALNRINEWVLNPDYEQKRVTNLKFKLY